MEPNIDSPSRRGNLAWLEATVIGSGWNLSSPSPECQAALALPIQLQGASYWDRFGIHVNLVSTQLLRRFWHGKHPCPERGWSLTLWGFSLVAQQELEGRREITSNELRIKHEGYHRWREQRFVPALERMRNATDSEIEGDPRSFEPALTHHALHQGLDLVNIEQNRAALSRGWQIHAEGKLSARSQMNLAEDELDRVFHWLSEADQIAFIDDDGQIHIDELMVKSAADKAVGPMPSVEEKRSQPSLEAIEKAGEGKAAPLEVRDVRAVEALAALEAQDTVQRVQELIDQELAGADAGSAKEFILREFKNCIDGAASWDGLVARAARASGRAPSTVSEALDSVKGRLARALSKGAKKI